MNVIFSVFLYAVALSGIAEYVSWLMVYRQSQYARLLQLQYTQQQNENAKKQQLMQIQQQLMPFTLRISIISLAAVLLGYQFLSNWVLFWGAGDENGYFAKLPFELWSMFSALQHRPTPNMDLTNDERAGNPLWTGPHLIFAMSLLLIRQMTQKILEYVGIKPITPTNGKSPWEMAMSEWDNMQQPQEPSEKSEKATKNKKNK